MNIVQDQLKSIVERIERLHEEKAAISEDIREIYVEAKANGFDAKALRHVVKLRGQDTAERQEFEAIVEMYMHALGMLPDAASRVAREGPPSDGAVKSVRHRRNPELARGAEEPASVAAGAFRYETSLSRERDDAQPEGGITGGSGPFRPDLEIPAQMRRA